MHRALLPAVLLSLACNRGKVSLSDLEDEDDILDACEEYETSVAEVQVVFPATTDACPWGEGDNIDAANGVFTARVEQDEALDLPEDSVICDLDFDFSGLVPDEVQVMVYDDHFFFTFNDIVLAASFGPAVEQLTEEEGQLRFYDWADVVGTDYHLDQGYQSYCLGQASGESECDIPDTEVEGPIALNFSEEIVSRLSLSAIQDERYEFAFVTTGDDNAESDCMHEEFGFTVEVPYLEGY
jgi:hypothetical protein